MSINSLIRFILHPRLIFFYLLLYVLLIVICCSFTNDVLQYGLRFWIDSLLEYT